MSSRIRQLLCSNLIGQNVTTMVQCTMWIYPWICHCIDLKLQSAIKHMAVPHTKYHLHAWLLQSTIIYIILQDFAEVYSWRNEGKLLMDVCSSVCSLIRNSQLPMLGTTGCVAVYDYTLWYQCGICSEFFNSSVIYFHVVDGLDMLASYFQNIYFNLKEVNKSLR